MIQTKSPNYIHQNRVHFEASISNEITSKARQLPRNAQKAILRQVSPRTPRPYKGQAAV